MLKRRQGSFELKLNFNSPKLLGYEVPILVPSWEQTVFFLLGVLCICLLEFWGFVCSASLFCCCFK